MFRLNFGDEFACWDLRRVAYRFLFFGFHFGAVAVLLFLHNELVGDLLLD